MTAQLLSVLGLPPDPRQFINGVPEACARNFDECMENIFSCLEQRGVARPDGLQSPALPSEAAYDQTEGMVVDQGAEEEAPEWGGD